MRKINHIQGDILYMEQDKQNLIHKTEDNTETDPNATLTHGLLAEDFKQNLLILVRNHQLDIQTKAIILDSILLSTNIVAKQQTEIELREYKKRHDNTIAKKEAS